MFVRDYHLVYHARFFRDRRDVRTFVTISDRYMDMIRHLREDVQRSLWPLFGAYGGVMRNPRIRTWLYGGHPAVTLEFQTPRSGTVTGQDEDVLRQLTRAYMGRQGMLASGGALVLEFDHRPRYNCIVVQSMTACTRNPMAKVCIVRHGPSWDNIGVYVVDLVSDDNGNTYRFSFVADEANLSDQGFISLLPDLS